jgi:hypothetical protein
VIDHARIRGIATKTLRHAEPPQRGASSFSYKLSGKVARPSRFTRVARLLDRLEESQMVARRKTSANVRRKAKKRRVVRRKTSAGARPKATKRKVTGRIRSAKVARAAAASDPVVEALKAQIAAGKIIFDAARLKTQLLGLNAGTRVTRKLQSLVLELSRLASPNIRISSLVRTAGHHGSGRAVDIGNEEIAGSLLPRVATDAQVAALGIDELIFDATVAGQSPRNKWNYDRGVKHDYSPATLDDHKDHIHFAVKA